jgi:predicted transposase YbfD/YdcC
MEDLSAFSATPRNEMTAIPALMERLDLKGALVSIDAMGCNTTIAQSILDVNIRRLFWRCGRLRL